MVAEALINAGHRKLAYVSGRPDTSTNRDRMKGFSSLADERGCGPCIVEPAGTYSYEAGYKAALRLMRTSATSTEYFARMTLLPSVFLTLCAMSWV